ncbi:MAG: glycosyltransferase family 39 protein [Bacteroidetes bacterium]|jgi:4-amino-4-deoxy-L-arabinose transferase-like glycosyltransferase|nr:glycosyltransferase family 39 protein [Bacteroidota bacterium]
MNRKKKPAEEPFWLSRMALFLLGGLCVIYGLGLMVPIIDLDSAQYAHMSRQMLEEGNYLQVREMDHDYLDKPPLLFWLGSLSYRLFGVAGWSFRLPTLLFGLLGLLSVYGMGRRLYSHRIGLMASLMCGSSLGFFIMVLDVKTDGLLFGSVAFSSWMLLAYLQDQRVTHFMLPFLGIGLGLLAKGPMGLMAPALAFTIHLVMARRWKEFFRFEWLVGLLLLALMLLPMLYGLYMQFGWQGPEFYLWTQSFGRITGASEWADDSGWYYFLHVALWVFFPWSLLVFGQIVADVWRLFRQGLRLRGMQEFLTAGGFILLFVGLSSSRYKLPHYLFVLLPFGSILAARALQQVASMRVWSRVLLGFHLFLILGVLALAGWVLSTVFPTRQPLLWAVLAATLLAAVWLLWHFRKNRMAQLFVPLFVVVLGGGFIMNAHFYPNLLTYQSSIPVAQELKKHQVPIARTVQFRTHLHSLDFYAGHYTHKINTDSADVDLRALQAYHMEVGRLWVYTTAEGYGLIKGRLPVERVYSYDYFKVQALSLPFLRPSWRHLTLEKRYLVVIPGGNDDVAMATP